MPKGSDDRYEIRKSKEKLRKHKGGAEFNEQRHYEEHLDDSSEGMRWRGVWAAGRVYTTGSVVRHEDRMWFAPERETAEPSF